MECSYSSPSYSVMETCLERWSGTSSSRSYSDQDIRKKCLRYRGSNLQMEACVTLQGTVPLTCSSCISNAVLVSVIRIQTEWCTVAAVTVALQRFDVLVWVDLILMSTQFAWRATSQARSPEAIGRAVFWLGVKLEKIVTAYSHISKAAQPSFLLIANKALHVRSRVFPVDPAIVALCCSPRLTRFFIIKCITNNKRSFSFNLVIFN